MQKVKATLIIALALFSFVNCHPEDVFDNINEIRAAQERFESNCGRRGVTCLVQNDVTEGPFYYQTGFLREDITEGKPGIPLLLRVTVVDVNTCLNLPNATVDLWHCDAGGVYSHFNTSLNAGGSAITTFLRGNQFTDSNGLAQFTSIFPAYYNGRATHIHFKVHVNGTTVDGSYSGGYVTHTGQLFFNDTFLDEVYSYIAANNANYTLSGTRTTLPNDNVYSGINYGIMDVDYINSAQGFSGGFIATISVGVNTSAVDSNSFNLTSGSSEGPNTTQGPPATGGAPPATGSAPPPTGTSSSGTSSTSSVSTGDLVNDSSTSSEVESSGSNVIICLYLTFGLLALLM